MTNSRTLKCAAVAGGVDGVHAPTADWTALGETGHVVQFYEQDDFLIETLAAFVGAGFSSGDAAVVIATRAHRRALEEKLQTRCVDVETLRAQGRYLPLDAAETLVKFMVDGAPDPALFKQTIGPVLTEAGRGQRRIRAFGEMVALLWAEGKRDAAVALERLWNALAEERPFALLCGYPMHGFAGAGDGALFHEVCCAHGRVIPAESYSLRLDEDARLRAITALQQKACTLEAEIDERKRAECAAREQHARFAMAAAIAHLGIWELDIVSCSLTCSEQCRAHFGFEPEEPVTYEGLFARIHPGDRDHVEAELKRTLADGTDYALDFRVVAPGGQSRWLAALGRCFHNGSHRVLGVTFDITAQRENAAYLERTVAERTAELRATVSELEAFSYSISHDMRAPLRSMQGFANVLIHDLGDKLDPESRSYLERICSAGERMDRLIQDVLTFSRVTRAELKLEPIHLHHVVCGVLECYANLQPPSAEITIVGELPTVLGNAAALTQCISNLLANAVKFVPPGTEPVVRLWATPLSARAAEKYHRSPPTQYVRLFVEDNGIGIARESQEKIFGLFQRVDKGYEGTGIGLAIVKKTVERMGGGVGVTSQPGRGSTFWIDLPLAATG